MNDDRIQYLLRGHLEGTLSPAERQELLTLADSPDTAGLLEAISTQLAEQEDLMLPLSFEEARRTVARIVAVDKPTVTDKEPEAEKGHSTPVVAIPWFRYAVAVSVIVFLGAAIYYWIAGGQKADRPLAVTSSHLSHEALPGSDRALLTLADGRTIVLDSITGNILQQEHLQVSNQDGKLDYEGKTNQLAYHTLTTPRGGQYQLQLPDGTNVWLNAASSITYPTSFLGRQRKVTITGEVYFEVANNKDQPFIVNVDQESEIEVLGTKFNVNAYKDEGKLFTTLLEGRVRISRVTSGVSRTLQPGQQAVLFPDSSFAIYNNTDIASVMAWKNGLFRFDNTPLSVVMRQLSRWYDVDVIYENGAVPNVRFAGKMGRDLNLSEILVVLEKMEVNFRIEGKTLIVMK